MPLSDMLHARFPRPQRDLRSDEAHGGFRGSVGPVDPSWEELFSGIKQMWYKWVHWQSYAPALASTENDEMDRTKRRWRIECILVARRLLGGTLAELGGRPWPSPSRPMGITHPSTFLLEWFLFTTTQRPTPP